MSPTDGAGVGLWHAVFYSACVISAFEHLYTHQILYRDFKPENLMADVGMAKVVLDKTYTMCSTHEYISTEVILHVRHNYAADH